MTDAGPLPKNIRDWPSDPFKLLGVEVNVTERDLRRSYVRLIKRYKPEQHPEEFRRIRDAYEQIKQEGDYRRPFVPSSDAADDCTLDSNSPIREATDEAGVFHGSEKTDGDEVTNDAPDLAIVREDLLAAAWQEACHSDPEAAYNEIVPLASTVPHSEDVYLRLYWLLRTFPLIDPIRSPCAWLSDGIRRYGLASRVGALYRNELSDSPDEAFNANADRLVAELRAPRDILAMLDCRWRAGARLDQSRPGVQSFSSIERMKRDIDTVGSRLQEQDELTWASMLVRAIELAAWRHHDGDAGLVANLSMELDGAQHLHYTLRSLLDHRDETVLTAAAWRRLRHQHREARTSPVSRIALELIREAAIFPISEIIQTAGACAAEMAASRQETLAVLDKFNLVSPFLVTKLNSALQQAAIDCSLSDPSDSREGLPMVVSNYVLESNWYNYSKFRTSLLDFCIHEAVDPPVVAELVRGDERLMVDTDKHLADAIDADVPLHCVKLADRLFWSA